MKTNVNNESRYDCLGVRLYNIGLLIMVIMVELSSIPYSNYDNIVCALEEPPQHNLS